MRLVSFGSVTLPQMNGAQDLPVPFRSSVIPLRGGGFDLDGRKNWAESKIVNAQFWVHPDDGDIDTIIDNILLEAAKGRRYLVATMRDNTEQRQQLAKVVNITTSPRSDIYMPNNIGGQGYETVQIQWQLVYPYWELTSDFHNQLDTGLTLDAGLKLDSGNHSILEHNSSSSTTKKTITNDGTTPLRKLTIVIYEANQPTIQDITITNETTGEWLKWTGTFGLFAGDFIEIDCLHETIKYNGANTWANTSISDEQRGFFHLELGDNIFSVAYGSASFGASESMYYRFDWHDHFIR